MPPKDKYHAAYWCYLIMGMGLLLPWNAFITAVDYFTALYPGKHVDRVIPVAYNVPNLLAMCATLPFSQTFGARLRIIVGFSGFLFCTVAIPVIDTLMLGGSGTGTTATYAITISLAALLGASDGVAQGSLFGAAGCLPARYTQAVCAGTSYSGLVVSLLRIATKAALPMTAPGLRSSAFLYFGIASATVALCIAIDGAVIPRLPVVKHFKGGGSALAANPARESGKKGDEPTPDLTADSGPTLPLGDAEIEMTVLENVEAADVDGDVLLLNPSRSTKPRLNVKDYLDVVRHMKYEAISLVVVYWVTLSIFPGFLAEDVHSESMGDWYPILLITAYNVGDAVGKGGPLVLPSVAPRAVLLLSLLRFLFIPAFILSAAYAAPAWVIGLLTLLLGATNGHLTACAMMSAPRNLDRVKAELSGILSALFLVLGITIGAFSGYAWGLV
mmetsp:Transcript_5948/g.15058  ORF Transcript_5948/g.15058 Transcript_5948/m.15058 type:complete len:444 (+) Transcript_5948:355-1686(+)|eukprot:jgi/Tetstr1/446070/TSEL_033672.t1